MAWEWIAIIIFLIIFVIAYKIRTKNKGTIFEGLSCGVWVLICLGLLFLVCGFIINNDSGDDFYDPRGDWFRTG
jgi:multisubunit Na+/H+ antiporter MnhB subunit